MKKYTEEWINGYTFEFWIDSRSGIPGSCEIRVIPDLEWIKSAEGTLLAILPEEIPESLEKKHASFREAHEAFVRMKIKYLWNR